MAHITFRQFVQLVQPRVPMEVILATHASEPNGKPNSTLGAGPAQIFRSLLRIIGPRGTTSEKSVRFNDSEDPVHPGSNPLHSSKGSSKPMPILKPRSTPVAGESSLPSNTSLIRAAHLAIDDILRELVTCVKQFRSPAKLDFPSDTDNGLVLLDSEKNRPFINQLRKLDDLRNKSAEISTHGDAQLENKHHAVGVAIERALQRMKEHQLKLYQQRVEVNNSHST